MSCLAWLKTCTTYTKESDITVQTTSDGAAVVDTEYFWIPIDEHTPRGAKLQLLGQGGVAIYSIYNGDKFWTHWCPLPKNSRKIKPYPSVVPDDIEELSVEWYSIGQMLIGAAVAALMVVGALLIFTGMYIGRMLI